LENWFKIEFVFAKNLNIVPSELDQMEFYRVEYMLQNYEEFIEEENKRNKDQESAQTKSMAQTKSSSMPKMPNMQVPKMNIPKF